MSSSSRASSPLATPGPRRWLAVSPQSAVNISLAAARCGVTQRMLVDALLGDVELVNRAARGAARKVARQRGGNAIGGAKSVKNGLTSSGASKTTHQDCAGRTQMGSDGV